MVPLGNESSPSALELAPEEYPNIDDVVIDDGMPVENLFVEKQQRLLTEPLYSSWAGPSQGGSFKVYSNVGLFWRYKQPPLVPDVMLALDIPVNVDLSQKENRSYFIWVIGKPPEVVIEIVSDRRGGEADVKMREYARIGVAYYVILDPANYLDGGVLRVFERCGQHFRGIDSTWMADVGLGLILWEGSYEEQPARWLRWCDEQGNVILTGQERAEQERQRAEQERQRADQMQDRLARLQEQLKSLGAEPTE